MEIGANRQETQWQKHYFLIKSTSLGKVIAELGFDIRWARSYISIFACKCARTHTHTHTHIYIYIYIVGISGSNKGIGPWVAPEDVGEPEDKLVSVKVSKLSG